MQNTDTLVAEYIDMWNETDPARRRELVARTVSDDARYVDPLVDGEGIDGISAMIGAVQGKFPGHRFALHSRPDAHHDRVRFSWSLAPDCGAEPIAIGVDFALLGPDGRMRSISGFLEPTVTGGAA